ncbi:microsomal epoxide hydrolase [Xylariaceae sp. FL1272]|nr:microsomal epoxide hydrolase [Xylariaceae sp. FL1272]
MSQIRPFKIKIPDSDIADLKSRLSRTRFPDENDDGANEKGSPPAAVKRIVEYWSSAFDWRKAETELNTFPHFETNITVDGFEPVSVHFIHVKSSKPSPSNGSPSIPLLFVHGWPGSFYEGTRLIKPLTEHAELAFDVVVPSLPNFGFSGGVSQSGFSVDQHAELLHKLMLRLGYDRYVTQGGDWGGFITRAMALRYGPRHLRAQHLNLAFWGFPSAWKTPLLFLQSMLTPFTTAERVWLKKTGKFFTEGNAYALIQGTRPLTVGYGLADSPVALLAWIYEKLDAWTGSGAYKWSDEEICTWVSIYWFSTAGPAASSRIYYEFQQNVDATLDHLRTWSDVKVGLARFPHDPCGLPFLWARQLGPVVLEHEHTAGGHFPAWEVPEAVVGDLVEMFGKGECAASLMIGT